MSERIIEDSSVANYKTMPVIYLITNLLTGKQYVGMTINIRLRINKYNSAVSSKILYRHHIIVVAMRKYGIHNFKIEIIDYADDNILLANLEKYYIKKLNTLRPYGYNISKGGLGGSFSCSEETKRKISLANKNRKWTSEQRLLCIEHRKGYKHTAQTKAKIGAAHKNVKRDKLFSENMSKLKKGMIHTDNAKNKISIGVKRAWESRPKKIVPEKIKQKYSPSEETRQKIRQARTGRIMSEETKAKIAKSHIGVKPWLGKTHTAETKQKIRMSKIGKTRPDLQTEEAKLRQRKNATKLYKPVKCVETGVSYACIADAARELGVSTQHLGYIIKHNKKVNNEFTIIKVGD